MNPPPILNFFNPDRIKTKSRWLPPLILLLTVLSLGSSFYYVWRKSKVIKYAEHVQYALALDKAQLLQAQINQHLLLHTNRLLPDATVINADVTALNQLHNDLQKLPAYVQASDREILNQQLQVYLQTWSHKQSLISSALTQPETLKALLALQTAPQIQSLSQLYEQNYQQELERVNRSETSFYVLSFVSFLGLLAMLSYYLFQLRDRVRQSQSKFRNIFDNSQVGIFRIRLEDGMILDANQRLIETLGYASADELINVKRSTDLYLDPKDRPRALNLLKVQGCIQNFETQFRRKDGSTFWGLLSARFNLEDECVDGVMTDISDRKQVEEALRASEAEMRALIAAMPDTIIVYNREGRCLEIAPTSPVDQLVKPAKDQINCTVYESLPPAQAPIHHRYILDALERQQTLSLEYNLAIAGEERWFAASVSPLSADTVLWVARDITNRTRIEGALKASETTKRALIEAIPDLLLRLRQDGTYLDVMNGNKFSLLNSTRLTPGTNVHDSLPPELAQKRLEAMRQSLVTGELQVYEQRLDINGEPHDEEVRIAVCGEDEVLLMVRDITARKQAEENLQKAVAAAEAANRAKSIFLANMSHELRTPLNIILGFTQLLIRGGSLNPQQQDQLNTINRSGEHLLTLINDVLEMSKIEAGRVTLNETDFDFHDLLDWLYQMFQFKSQSKGLQFTIQRSPNSPEFIRTDESKLRQVLVNLVGNAVKFTQTGSVTLRVGVKPYEEAVAAELLMLTFEVEDTGPGIASADLSRLFQPFVQTDTGHKSQEGTGLGLAISQKFVQLMGGEIKATSEVGRGALFKFHIRTEVVETAVRKSAAASRQVVGLEPGQPQYRILIVEDKPENREILTQLLIPVGFDVQEATNGLEGVQAWETGAPDLIWMDIRMPVMDGYEATKQIMAASKVSDRDPPVIIALTGSVFEEDRKIAMEMGCRDFVRKPFRTEEIFEKMAEYLGVQYIYADQVTADNGSNPAPAENFVLTSKSLGVMPMEWIEALDQAATKVSAKLVTNLIDQIPAQHAQLASALTQLVNDFCFEEIVELTQYILPP
jgi:PAS domain S-box-containing protein